MSDDPRMLRERLDDLQEELREIETWMDEGGATAEMKARRDDILAEIMELESKLDEIGL